MSTQLAGNVSDCCVVGFQHEGTAKGSIIQIAGFPTYIASPAKDNEGPKKVILFLADIYSPLHLNNQLIQDFYATQGLYIHNILFLPLKQTADHATIFVQDLRYSAQTISSAIPFRTMQKRRASTAPHG